MISNLTGISVSLDLSISALAEHGAIDQLLVAADLHADILADVIGRRLDAGLGQREQHKGIAPVDDRQCDDGNALAAGNQDLIGAGHAELLVASGHHLHGGKVGTAGLDIHVEALGFVVALLLRHVKPGELRLIEPFEAQGNRLIGRTRWRTDCLKPAR